MNLFARIYRAPLCARVGSRGVVCGIKRATTFDNTRGVLDEAVCNGIYKDRVILVIHELSSISFLGT
jgi:hypothetical protein